MSAATVLAAGRRSAEALMSARCKITRLKKDTLDSDSLLLLDTDPSDDLVLESPCRLRARVARVQTSDQQGQLLALQQLELHLPVLTSGGVRIGDTVEILDGGDDPTETGLQLRIEGRAAQTQATAHRFPVTLITSTPGS